jgi:hypothetical protein
VERKILHSQTQVDGFWFETIRFSEVFQHKSVQVEFPAILLFGQEVHWLIRVASTARALSERPRSVDIERRIDLPDLSWKRTPKRSRLANAATVSEMRM